MSDDGIKNNTNSLDDLLGSKQVKLLDSDSAKLNAKTKSNPLVNSKLVATPDDQIGVSTAEIEKMREDFLAKIEDHLKKANKDLNTDDLSSYSLANKIELLEKSKFMLNEYMLTVLTTLSSSSRAYEVLAKMLDTIVSINGTLVPAEDKKGKGANVKTKEDGSVSESTTDIIKSIVGNNLDNLIEINKANKKKKEA